MTHENLNIKPTNDSSVSEALKKAEPNFGDRTQITGAQMIIEKVMNKEETFLSRIFPSKEVRARREKDTELIKQSLEDRNKMYSMLRETQRKYFAEQANIFLSDKMISGKVYLVSKMSEGINEAIGKFESEQEKFYHILQQKADVSENWQGSLKPVYMKRLEGEIEKLLDAFQNVKFGLISDLENVRNLLIKA